jgi:hypothetical protein
MGFMSVIPTTQEAEIGWPQTKARPYLKNKLKAKGVGNMAHEVEFLPSKHKAEGIHHHTIKTV